MLFPATFLTCTTLFPNSFVVYVVSKLISRKEKKKDIKLCGWCRHVYNYREKFTIRFSFFIFLFYELAIRYFSSWGLAIRIPCRYWCYCVIWQHVDDHMVIFSAWSLACWNYCIIQTIRKILNFVGDACMSITTGRNWQ